jgi:hypothetical protein
MTDGSVKNRKYEIMKGYLSKKCSRRVLFNSSLEINDTVAPLKYLHPKIMLSSQK